MQRKPRDSYSIVLPITLWLHGESVLGAFWVNGLIVAQVYHAPSISQPEARLLSLIHTLKHCSNVHSHFALSARNGHPTADLCPPWPDHGHLQTDVQLQYFQTQKIEETRNWDQGTDNSASMVPLPSAPLRWGTQKWCWRCNNVMINEFSRVIS